MKNPGMELSAYYLRSGEAETGRSLGSHWLANQPNCELQVQSETTPEIVLWPMHTHVHVSCTDVHSSMREHSCTLKQAQKGYTKLDLCVFFMSMMVCYIFQDPESQ